MWDSCTLSEVGSWFGKKYGREFLQTTSSGVGTDLLLIAIVFANQRRNGITIFLPIAGVQVVCGLCYSPYSKHLGFHLIVP